MPNLKNKQTTNLCGRWGLLLPCDRLMTRVDERTRRLCFRSWKAPAGVSSFSRCSLIKVPTDRPIFGKLPALWRLIPLTALISGSLIQKKKSRFIRREIWTQSLEWRLSMRCVFARASRCLDWQVGRVHTNYISVWISSLMKMDVIISKGNWKTFLEY